MTERDEPRRIEDCMMSFSFRPGGDSVNYTGDVIIFIPGLGCSKDWFISAFRSHALRNDILCSFDLPNQGDWAPSRSPKVLWEGQLMYLYPWVNAVYELIANSGQRFHFVAHSMGTIAGLHAWRHLPEHRRGAFISIEGNLTGEDCFASSQMAQGLVETEAFIDRMRASTDKAQRVWGNEMLDCDPEYLHCLAKMMVKVCATGDLTDRWKSLRHPHYLYGAASGYPEHHRALFEQTGTHAVAIPDAGHFPMFDNRTATWDAVAAAVRSTRDRRDRLA